MTKTTYSTKVITMQMLDNFFIYYLFSIWLGPSSTILLSMYGHFVISNAEERVQMPITFHSFVMHKMQVQEVENRRMLLLLFCYI